jgi:hypothetical protein
MALDSNAELAAYAVRYGLGSIADCDVDRSD